jgi:hypothetical protein
MKLTIKDIILIFFALITVILTIILLTKDDTRENELKAEIQALKAKQQTYKDSIKVIDEERAKAYKELIILGNMTTELQKELNEANIKTIKTKKQLENEKRKSIIIPDSTIIDSIFTSILQGR